MPRSLPAHVTESLGTMACALTFSRPVSESGNKPPTKQVGIGQERRSLVISVGNPFPYRMGGPFYQVTRYERWAEKTDYVDVRRNLSGFEQGAVGPVVMIGTSLPRMPASYLSWGSVEAELAPWGATGWNRTRPTKPLVDLNVFLGELRDLPRNPFRVVDRVLAKGRGKSRAEQFNILRREIGSEYLNYDFGWRPFIDDTLKLLDFQERVSERLSRMSESYRQGRNIRRRVTLSETHETSESVTYSPNWSGSIGSIAGSGTWPGTRTTITGTKRKIWYVAGYRMRVDLSDPQYVRSARRALLGSTPTLGQVWSLTPWSWMAGWFTNVGDALQNLTDPLADYYAAAYACVMMEKKSYTRVELNLNRTDTSYKGTTQVSLAAEAGSITKARVTGSPFGFGVTWDGLSPSQLATAAALGISRT